MTADTERWDQELRRIEQVVPARIASKKDTDIIGIAVDDGAKRDYFLPRLQRMLDEHRWSITFRVITVTGGHSVTDLKGKGDDEGDALTRLKEKLLDELLDTQDREKKADVEIDRLRRLAEAAYREAYNEAFSDSNFGVRAEDERWNQSAARRALGDAP